MVVVVVDIFVYDICRCTSHPLLILCAYSSKTITVGVSMTVRNCRIQDTCKMSNLKFFFIVFVVIDAIAAVLLVLMLMWLGTTADFYLVP